MKYVNNDGEQVERDERLGQRERRFYERAEREAPAEGGSLRVADDSDEPEPLRESDESPERE